MFQCLSGSRIPPCCLPPRVLQPVPEQPQVLYDWQCPNLRLSATSVHLRFSKWPGLPAQLTGMLYSWTLSSHYLGKAQTSGLERRAHTTKYLNICKLPLCPLGSLAPPLQAGCHSIWQKGFKYVPHSYWQTSTSGTNPISPYIRR